LHNQILQPMRDKVFAQMVLRIFRAQPKAMGLPVIWDTEIFVNAAQEAVGIKEQTMPHHAEPKLTARRAAAKKQAAPELASAAGMEMSLLLIVAQIMQAKKL
jgi:hypothetical protein